MDDRTYCLYKHFAAFYRQAKCCERAEFAEPCETCKIWNKCKADWESLLLTEDVPEDARISMRCHSPNSIRCIGYRCPDTCKDYGRHMKNLPVLNRFLNFLHALLAYSRQILSAQRQ